MTDRRTLYNQFIQAYGEPVKRNEPMSAHTTFGTGGEADLFIDATDTGSLSRAIQLARGLSIPYFVIGEGSNLLVSDTGFRGLIVRNCIPGLEVKGNMVTAGAGENLNRVVDYATGCALTGFEFAAGIWGTIGGAIYGNAGAFGSQISSLLDSAELMDKTGNLRWEDNAYFAFAYRHSKLKETGEIVVRGRFRLEPGDRENVSRRVDEIRELRRGKHPVDPCRAGCFFKNVPAPDEPHGKLPAGRLLEEIGAKTMTVGGAGVFDRHANIIVNRGGASSKDIRKLADMMKEKVKERFHVELEEEVICLGEF